MKWWGVLTVCGLLAACATPEPQMPAKPSNVQQTAVVADVSKKKQCHEEAVTGSLVQKKIVCENDEGSRNGVADTMQQLDRSGPGPVGH